MKSFEDELKELVFEYAAVPSTGGAREMASFCKALEEGVEAINEIARGLGNSDANPHGQHQAMAIVTTQLLFNIRVMRLLLLKEAGF
jgi:hypothetical protein